jgi:hypothetical protein
MHHEAENLWKEESLNCRGTIQAFGFSFPPKIMDVSEEEGP